MVTLPEPKNYAFKKTFSDVIPPINFLTHNLYSYPAKFIAHVPYYVISKFLKNSNGVVLDPFAGSGSTAIEALRLGHHCICIDINPLTKFLTEVKTQRIGFELHQNSITNLDSFMKLDKLPEEPSKDLIYLDSFMKKLKKNKNKFYPNWSNIDHWYPEEFKHILARIWGYLHSIESENQKEFMNLAKLSALYLSRYLSYGARDVPKLFKSKRRIRQIEILRKEVQDKPEIPYNVYSNKMLAYFKQMKQLSINLEKNNITPEYDTILNELTLESNEEGRKKIITLGETDVLNYEFAIQNEFIDLIITSPPYIYAQEYMRSTKLDLYWLNLADDSRIRELTKREIGNKKDTNIDQIINKLGKIDSFNSIVQKLDRVEKKKYGRGGKYVSLVYNYFYDMYLIIEKLRDKLKKKGIFGLFIGNPTVMGYLVPCQTIFCEIFQDQEFKIVEFGYDQILSPRLLKGRKNLSPEGMNAEWLIIAEKI